MSDAEPFRFSAVLGAIVHTERVARSVTQQQLAQSAGLHPMAVSKIERGVQRDVGIETVRRIATALSAAGPALSTTDLIASAERWQLQLVAELSGGTLPAADSNVTGSALAAVIVLIASRASPATQSVVGPP